MLNQQPPNFLLMFSTWLTWETDPFILAGPSCALALSLALKLLGQVASGKRDLRVLPVSLAMGGIAVACGILAWQRGMAMLSGAADEAPMMADTGSRTVSPKRARRGWFRWGVTSWGTAWVWVQLRSCHIPARRSARLVQPFRLPLM